VFLLSRLLTAQLTRGPIAYFEDGYDAVFGVVYRPEFEARLRAHFEQNTSGDIDPAWYALRNTVYASGCRQFLSKSHSVTFVDAQAQAWRYFENALSVHGEILYSSTGLLAVQALAAMVRYISLAPGELE